MSQARTRPPRQPVCVPVRLGDQLLVRAAKTATTINPANAPKVDGIVPALTKFLAGLGTEGALDLANLLQDADPLEVVEGVSRPEFIAVLTTKYWGTGGVDLSVSFLETTRADLQAKILASMNRWGEKANVKFAATARDGDVRISRGPGGYWSYLGTDIRHIPRGQQTMNLEGFTLKTPDSEYERVVCHEAGHTLGAPHEHMRPALVDLLDPARTIAYFRQTQGWSAQEVQEQVLTPLDEASLLRPGGKPGPTDQDSIMCYQIPGQCTRSGKPILGGTTITAHDFAYMAKIYPRQVQPPPQPANRVTIVTVLDKDTNEVISTTVTAGSA